ncbi:ABC transporter ATP-binding protein [Actinomadura sp. SCN-SB]|uniref:ABC transporter ATP-binding protein n=1 Tax=Actinomadura sp. SCN-SB TaxID=3373092 RepID=UPI003752AA92
MSLLAIHDLRVRLGGTEVLRGVDLRVGAGEKVALVGESGSGKSVTARTILRLDRDAEVTGRIDFDGTDLLSLPGRALREVRGARIGLVFQDPLASLNPVMTVGWQIMQPLVIRGVRKKEARRRGIDLLGRLGVRDAARRFDDYPHQFSGGMRQRVVIAIAVIAEPDLLIADEPTTALDVRVQAQVLTLMRELADERGMAVLLITHDLGIVANFADRVVVMRHGAPVEEGPVRRIYASPRHPYTKALLAAVPRIDGDRDRRLSTVEMEDR